MLPVARINRIRDLRDGEGLSITGIAQVLKLNWRTAKKYADGEVLSADGPRIRRPRPVIGPYMETIDDWLEEDLRMPAKQRRTARKIYRDLRDLGYAGSERTVRAYVEVSRSRLQGTQAERYMRLDHAPGEAQVDFGEVKILGQDGNVRTHHLLVMSFPHSNAALARVLPAANTECFLEGLKSMFVRAGGVPREIWLDNLSPAVKKVLRGENREVTEAFGRFRWHYRFQASFCRPGCGNEKGSVENKVGYIRRNYLTPMPVTDDIDDLNQRLCRDLEADMERIHYLKQVPIAKLWEADRRALLPLPTQEFEVFRPATAVVNHVCEIKVGGDHYHVPGAMPRQKLFLKLLWDRIDIYDAYGEQKLGVLCRRYAFKADQVDWAAELRVLSGKPRAVERATYLKALPEIVRDFILGVELTRRRGRMKTLIALFEAGHGLQEIEEIVRMGLGYDVADEASLKAIAAHVTASEYGRALAEPHTPDQVRDWRPDLTRYDLLTGEVAGGD